MSVFLLKAYFSYSFGYLILSIHFWKERCIITVIMFNQSNQYTGILFRQGIRLFKFLRNAFLLRSFASFEERVPVSFLFVKKERAFLFRSFFVPFQFFTSLIKWREDIFWSESFNICPYSKEIYKKRCSELVLKQFTCLDYENECHRKERKRNESFRFRIVPFSFLL